MLEDVQPGFAKKDEPKVNFFTQKLPDLGPVLNKLMQPKRVIGRHRHS